MPRDKRLTTTKLEVADHVDIGQRVSIGLISLSLSLISLSLGLAFLRSPAVLLVVPSTIQSVTPSSSSAVTLTWTAPGDDDAVGQATSYEIRSSTAPITAVNFSEASLVANPPAPQPAGSTESFSVSNLNPETTYFFALKSYDEAGNVSLISNVATKTTDPIAEACVPGYACSAWSTCNAGVQTRTCTVTNGCVSDLDKPITSQTCTLPDPEPIPVGGEDVPLSPVLAAGVAERTIPVVRTVDYKNSRVLREWLSLSRIDRRGVNVAVGDVTGDHQANIIVGSGKGSDPIVKIYSSQGELLAQFNPYPASRKIGVSVTTGDVDGDGRDEILTVAAGSASHVRIFSYDSSTRRATAIAQTFAYNFRHRNGFTIEAGDLNLDGQDEFIVSARTNGLTVTVLKMNPDRTIKQVAKFVPYGRVFSSGITMAIGDINGDGRGDIVTTPGSGFWSHVKVFTMRGTLMSDFQPTSTAYRGGLDLATLDVNQDGREEILTGSYGRGDPGVWAFRYNGLTKRFDRIQSMFVFPRSMQDGLRIDAAPHT